MDANQTEVTAEQIEELLAQDMTKAEIGEQFGISAQKVGMILAAAKKDKPEDKPAKGVVDPELVGEIPPSAFAKEYSDSVARNVQYQHITIMTSEEYEEYSLANDRVFGRPKDVKTNCTIEELRALINSGWTPKMIMDKHGLNADEFQQLVWQLSKAELRDKPINYSIERNFIQK